MKNYKCDYPKVTGFFIVSKYMIKKYGVIEALKRTLRKCK